MSQNFTNFSEKINWVLSIMHSRTDLLPIIEKISHECGFSFSDLTPKSPSEFGDLKTVEEVRTLRYQNFEKRRIRKCIQLLREMKARNLLNSRKYEPPCKETEKTPKNPNIHELKTLHRFKVHEAAALNSVMNLQQKLEKLESKEKRYQLSISRINELKTERSLRLEEKELKRQRILEKKREEHEKKEKLGIEFSVEKSFKMNKSVGISRSSVSIENEDRCETQRKLEKIMKKLQHGSERANKFKVDISLQASRLGNLSKTKALNEERSREKESFLQKKFGCMIKSMKEKEESRNRMLKEKEERLLELNEIKRAKSVENERKKALEIRELEENLRNKEILREKKLKYKKEEQDIKSIIENEKKIIKMQNHRENINQKLKIKAIKVKKIIEEASRSNSPFVRTGYSPKSLQESLMSTRLNTCKLVANLRNKTNQN